MPEPRSAAGTEETAPTSSLDVAATGHSGRPGGPVASPPNPGSFTENALALQLQIDFTIMRTEMKGWEAVYPSSLASSGSVRAVCLVVIVALGFAVSLQPAAATNGQTWWVDDGCGNPNNSNYPYYYGEGPAAYWHGYSFSGGPTINGNPSCMMWTNNTFSYVSVTY